MNIKLYLISYKINIIKYIIFICFKLLLFICFKQLYIYYYNINNDDYNYNFIFRKISNNTYTNIFNYLDFIIVYIL